MRRVTLALVLLAGALIALGTQARAPTRSPAPGLSPDLLRSVYLRGLDSLGRALVALQDLPPEAGGVAARAAFRRARNAYKRVEYLIEFPHAYLGIALNGPALPSEDEDDPARALTPTGLQVIEGVLFPELAGGFREVIDTQVVIMRRVLRDVRGAPPDTLDAARRPFDAARSEVARIATLGLAGFDATRSGDGLRESAAALEGVREGLQVYAEAMRARDSASWNALQAALRDAGTHLEASADFKEFDRLDFLTRSIRPITTGLRRLHQTLNLPPATQPSIWAVGATDVYARGALAAEYFAPSFAPPTTYELVRLGERLFFDPELSVHRRRSCATCHQPDRAFTDGLARARVDPGHGAVRNSPSLLHAGLQRFQFADQRADFLEFQVEAVLGNPREMGLALSAAAARLGADSGLRMQFAAALGKPPSEAVTEQAVMVALAAYVRSLGRIDSRFDRAVQGDTGLLTAAERRGFTLFMGKAACATCHFPPLFNGTQPPHYREAEPEVIGVPARPLRYRAAIDPDPGVFAIRGVLLHRYAFKTPTVRNVAVTAPYMHNGVFRTLDEVVEFYDRGGGAGLGIELPNQTLSPEPLRLTELEKHDLVAFMRSLTDSAYEAQAPPIASRP